MAHGGEEGSLGLVGLLGFFPGQFVIAYFLGQHLVGGAQLLGAFLDQLFQMSTVLPQFLVELLIVDGVVAESVKRPTHVGQLVVPFHRDIDVVVTLGNRPRRGFERQ